MGIIERQSLKNITVRYVGTFISVLATFFIYSNYKEIYGLYAFLISGAMVLSPLILMGGGSISTKFHPLNSSKAYDHLFTWLLMLAGVGFVSVTVLFAIFEDPIQAFFLDEASDPLIKAYFYVVLPLALLVSLKNLMANYISNYKRIVIPQVLDDMTVRIVIPVMVLATGLGFITTDRYIAGMLGLFALVCVMLFVYLRMFEKPQFRIPKFLQDSSRRKAILLFGGFAVLSSFGTILTTRIDTLMVGKMIDLTNAGAYAILLFLTNLVLIPKQAVYAISAPIMAGHMERQELVEAKQLYRSSSIVLLIAGLLISGMILLNVEDIISIMPKNEEFSGYLAVTIALCLTQIMDMTLSMNAHILIYSRYYWVNLILLMFLSVSNIAFNLYFIPIYGLAGAAVSTMLSVFLLNVAGLAVTYWLFRVQPFTRNTFFVLLLAGSAFVLTDLVNTGNAVANIALKSSMYVLLFGIPLYLLRLSDEFNRMVTNRMQMVQKWIRK